MEGNTAWDRYREQAERQKRKPKDQAAFLGHDNGVPKLILLSEDALAQAYVEQYAGNLLFDHMGGKWYVWDGVRWKREDTRLAFDWVRQLVRRLNAAGRTKWNRASVFSAVETIARADRAFAVTVNDFDADPWLLGTPAGIVDLKNGKLMPSDPARRISKSTSVGPSDPGTTPDRWLRFLDEATCGDGDLIRFLRQVLGYSLTGQTTEQMLIFIFGPGGNGKGVFINVVSHIFGDYSQAADMATFTASKHDRHPTELAALKGARLVTASETERDRFWAESRIKQLTGGDKVRARFMRQDEFEFKPQFQLVIIGNHKPRIRSVDDAMRRRLNLINFMHKPVKANPNLEAELLEESPSILRWMIDGCLDWQKNGLIRPQVVIDDTAEYFEEQNLVQRWMDECCEIDPKYSEKASVLYRSWCDFAKMNGEEPCTQTAFGSDLGRLGFPDKRTKTGVIRFGLRLKPQEAKTDPRNPGEWDS